MLAVRLKMGEKDPPPTFGEVRRKFGSSQLLTQGLSYARSRSSYRTKSYTIYHHSLCIQQSPEEVCRSALLEPALQDWLLQLLCEELATNARYVHLD